MSKKYFILVFLFNLIIATAYFLNNIDAPISKISGDSANIIPICKKLDNPDLFLKDLYLNDINNVKYYTPFYVQTIRFIASYNNFDYVKALNILGFATHLCYGILWFFFYYFLKKDFWLAFTFSVFMRGVIWPPGAELLGISELWSIMPRTVFIALIPVPFLIYKIFGKVFIAAIILGLLVNFHPISGIGAIIIYLSLYIFYNYLKTDFSYKLQFKQLLLAIAGILLGMMPYFLIYLTTVKANFIIDQKLFEVAIHARIDEVFFDGLLFIKSWNRPYTYFFALFFILYYFFDSSIKKINFKILLLSIIIILAFANSLPFLEKIINTAFDLHFRIAFQLIRCQKLIIILLQVAMYLFLFEFIQKYPLINKFKSSIFVVYLFLLTLTSTDFMSKIPFLSDDISNYILPNNLKFESKNLPDDGAIAIFEYVNKNTKLTDLFYCQNKYFRTATNRSEAFDFHAAGMLIEGNPAQYLKAYQNALYLMKSNCNQKIEFLKKNKVDYIIDNEKWEALTPIIKIKEYYIYKLK